MRMFNIKNKSAMPYIVTHERTGRVGRRHFEDTILFTKSFEEWKDANDYLESLSSSIKKLHSVIGCYSNFDGTFLVIKDDHMTVWTAFTLNLNSKPTMPPHLG